MNKLFPQSRSAWLGFLALSIPTLILLLIGINLIFYLSPLLLMMSFRLGFTILLAIGISLGLIGLKKSSQREPTRIHRTLCMVGILFSLAISYLLWNYPKVTGVITDIQIHEQGRSRWSYTRFLQIRADEPFPDFAYSHFYGAPIFITNTTGDTLVLKQTIGPITTVANQDQLEVNQHIEIVFTGSIYTSDPVRIDAVMIRILGP